MLAHNLTSFEILVIEMDHTFLLLPFDREEINHRHADEGKGTYALICITSFSSVSSVTLPWFWSRISFTSLNLRVHKLIQSHEIRDTHSFLSSSSRLSLIAPISKLSSTSLSSSAKSSSSLAPGLGCDSEGIV